MCPLPDNDTIINLGGYGLTNYGNLPPSNTSTDIDNTKLGPALCDVAGMTQVLQRVAVTATLAATTGGMVLNNYYSVWYNATNTLPTMSRTSTGIFVFTFPTTVSDEYNNSFAINNNHTVNLKVPLSAGFTSSTTPGFINIAVTAANQITVYTFSTGATPVAADFAGSTIYFTAR
jgi:hypothetical protein